MNLFKKWQLIAVLFLPSLIIFSQDFSEANQEGIEAQEVVVSGMGSIIDGDVAHARDDAISDALRRSVETALGTLVESETLVENFQLIEDRIYSKSKGYVQGYDIVKEEQRNEMLYEVTLKAIVKMADLKSDLEGIATLIRRKNTPRMMVMIDERNIGDVEGSINYVEADLNIAETALIDLFMQKGFKFVDQSVVKQNLDNAKAAAILQGDVAQAAALARMVGADVILTGKALAKATVVEVYGTTQRSQQASLTARAIRSDTGDIIATGSAEGAFPHIDDVVGGKKAIEKACLKLSEQLLEKILTRWQQDVTSGTTLSLQIKGISGYEQLSKLKASLPYYVRGLESVIQRDWVGDMATLEITMKGNSDDLAQALSNKKVEGIHIQVVGMSQNSVSIEIKNSQ